MPTPALLCQSAQNPLPLAATASCIPAAFQPSTKHSSYQEKTALTASPQLVAHRQSFRQRAGRACLVLLLLMLWSGNSALAAAVHIIRSEGELRTAITNAANGDTISFGASININSVLPQFTNPGINIQGNGYFIDGSGAYQILNISAGSLSGIGNIVMHSGTTSAADGGAVFVFHNLENSINSSQFTDNTAGNSGGAVYVGNDLTGGLQGLTFERNTAISGEGGAMLVLKDLNGGINSSRFTGNKAGNYGGAVYVGNDLTGGLQGSTFESNTATGGDGGAVFVFFDLTDGINSSIFTENQTKNSDGGAVSIGNNLTGGITSSLFKGNTAKMSGGAVWVATDLTNGIKSSTFTRNTAGMSGGAVLVTKNLQGDIQESTFSSNTATNSDGGAVSIGNALKGSIIKSSFTGNTAGFNGGAVGVTLDLTGGITNSSFAGNTATSEDGGAVHVGGSLTGGLQVSSFTANTAGKNGGAVYIKNDFTSGITNSSFADNTAGNNGGVVHINSGAFNGRIEDSSFTDNHAADYGGAIFLNTEYAGNAHAVELFATKDQLTVFADNTDQNGPNSLHFGRLGGLNSMADASLAIGGAGDVLLYDPISSDMNNGKNFTLTRDDKGEGGMFLWDGTNTLYAVGGTAAVNLQQGLTILLPDFQLTSDAGTTLSVNFGSAHILELDQARNPATAAFDFNSSGPASSITLAGRITAPRSLLSGKNDYLLAQGANAASASLANIAVDSTAFFTGSLFQKPAANELWLSINYNPYVNAGPNAKDAEYATDQWLNFSQQGLSLNGKQLDDLIINIDSLLPESAMTIVAVGKSTHDAAVATARQQAFAKGASIASSNALKHGFNNSALLDSHLAGALLEKRTQGLAEGFTAPAAMLGYQSILAHADSLGDSKRTRHNNAVYSALTENLSRNAAASAAKSGSLPGNYFTSSFAGHSAGIISTHSPTAENNSGISASVAGSASDSYGLRLWTGYLGSRTGADSHGGYSGYDADTNGFLVGGTLRLFTGWSAALYSGYSRTDTDFKDISASVESNALHLGGMLRYERGPFRATGDLGLSKINNDMERSVIHLSSSKSAFDQSVLSFGTEFAYDLTPWENSRLTPFISARYSHLAQQGFTEHGGGIDSKVDSVDREYFSTTAGAAFGQSFALSDNVLLVPGLSLAWRHEFGDTQTTGSAQFVDLLQGTRPISFQVKSREDERDAALIGLSLDTLFKLKGQSSLGLNLSYGAELYGHKTSQTVYAGFEFNF